MVFFSAEYRVRDKHKSGVILYALNLWHSVVCNLIDMHSKSVIKISCKNAHGAHLDSLRSNHRALSTR